MKPPYVRFGLYANGLRAGGRLWVPVEEGYQQFIYIVDKDKDGSVQRKKQFGVMYVPLTDAPEED